MFEKKKKRISKRWKLINVFFPCSRFLLQESIVGVNEIYKNLGALVFEQGNVIDSIESSVEQTSIFVSEGTEQLRKASHYRNQIRKKKFLIAMILIAIVVVFALVIYFS